MRFILSRVDDHLTHSKKWILGYAALFWVITRILAAVAISVCMAIYANNGLNPAEMTVFGGSPQKAETLQKFLFSLAVFIVIAPLIEEGVFRLGLSFRRSQVALAVALIPIFAWWSRFSHFPWWLGLVAVAAGGTIFFLIQRFTSIAFWESLRQRWLITAMWLTSIAFGLMHLIAFSVLNLTLLPYALCMILAPFFLGCTAAYVRVNLGFWWGVGVHIFNNIPGVVFTVMMFLA